MGQDSADRAGSARARRTLADRVQALYPPTIGQFYRVSVRRYDPSGENVSVGYNYFRGGVYTLVAFTAYFYPPPRQADSLDAVLPAEIREITSRHRGARIVDREPITVTKNGRQYTGRKVTFRYTESFGGATQPLISELHLFHLGPRLVKYRITYPAADAAEAQQRLESFLSAFPWASGLEGSEARR